MSELRTPSCGTLLLVSRSSWPYPLYAFTPSALDGSLAPPGHHTVSLACPAAPSRVEGGWPARRDELVEAALETMERRAPGFRSTIQGVSPWTPDDMEQAGGWPGGHPMHLDIALDQLGPFRPTRQLLPVDLREPMQPFKPRLREDLRRHANPPPRPRRATLPQPSVSVSGRS